MVKETLQEKQPANVMRSSGDRGRWQKVLLWLAGVMILLALLLFIVSFFLDEPLRKYTEETANRILKGYSVRLPGLHLQLVGGSLTFKGLTILQDAHPEPPIAAISEITASISWRDIIHGKLVAAVSIEQPRMHIDLKQLKTEMSSEEKVKDRGWQEAIEAVYPLKINRLKITDGSITYLDPDADKPLHLSKLNVHAGNIRNIRVASGVYPSSLHIDTMIFDTGKGVFDGNANFLSQPVPGVKGDFKFEKISLDYFKPVAARSNISVRDGMLSLSGRIEYSPTIASFQVDDLILKNLEMDYVHTAQTAAVEKKRAKKVGKAAKEASNKPEVQLRIGQFKLTGGTLGVVNRDAQPPYRVFLADTEFSMTNLTNHFIQGPAMASLTGKFMGTGVTKASAEFRPEKNGPDFDLQLQVENTRLKDMNQVFRAYGNFDVTEGLFHFYSDLHVRNEKISGYVKPLFKDMKVYDRRQDKEKSAFRKLYEMLVGGVSNLLENRPREEMATKIDVSGSLTEPQTNTWQVVTQLIVNAFFKAILPGFEREVTQKR